MSLNGPTTDLCWFRQSVRYEVKDVPRRCDLDATDPQGVPVPLPPSHAAIPGPWKCDQVYFREPNQYRRARIDPLGHIKRLLKIIGQAGKLKLTHSRDLQGRIGGLPVEEMEETSKVDEFSET